jgi:hypothetical protein
LRWRRAPPLGQSACSGSATHDIKEKATDQFERMADKATVQKHG